MNQVFLDTNIFLRHLLNDDPEKAAACFELILAIEHGRASGWTSDLVVAELVFVLTSRRTYNLSREDVRDRLLPILLLNRLKISHKRLYPRIFDLYVTLPIDYIDCYHVALLEQRKEGSLYSYDRDFDLVSTVERLEPPTPPPGPPSTAESRIR